MRGQTLHVRLSASAGATYAPGVTPDLEVARDIAAAPADVYAALTDISRMGDWSPETFAAEWNDGFDGAAVGAMFTGHNRNGDKEWSTEATIVDLVPDERFFFDCSVRGFVFAKWGYAIEATDVGCRVTEYAQDLRPDEIKSRTSEISGVEDRLAHNRAGMEVTLDRLAAAVE
jgi:uncharacterized protein YndB with AHSA1/START domain